MSYLIDAIPPYLPIGNQMENCATVIAFDISAWQAEFAEIRCAITMIGPGGGLPYPVSGVTQEGSILTWVVGRDATQRGGTGSIVIRGFVGDVEKRSLKRRVTVETGHPAAGEAPDAVTDWLSEALAAQTALAAARLTFADKTAAVGDWADSGDGSGYPYKASVACEGVSADMEADVYFAKADAENGNYSGYADCGAGVVNIYAAEIPGDTLTIPTIKAV